MGQLQFPPVFFLLVLSGLMTTASAWFVYSRRKDARGALLLFILLLSCSYWSLVYALQIALPPSPLKYWVGAAINPAVSMLPLMWLLFSLEYSGRSYLITRSRLFLLSIEPLLTILLILTNPYHRLFYASETRQIVEAGGFFYMLFDPGPYFWVRFAYTYTLLILGSINLLTTAWWMRKAYQFQAIVLLAAVFLPWGSNFISILALVNGWPLYVDLTPIFLSFSGILFVVAVFRLRVLELTPLARDLLFELLEDALIIVDTENRVVDINPAACRLLEVEANRVIGKPAANLFQDVRSTAERFAQVMEAHEVISLTLGGETAYFDLRILPLRSEQKGPAGRMILLRDMSTIYRAQQALKESEARYRRLIESSPEIILVLNQNGNILLANPTAVEKFDLPVAVIEDQINFCQLVVEQDCNEATQILRLALESGQTQILATRVVAWDGYQFPVEMYFAPLESGGSQTREVLCLMRDVTEQKRAEERLIQAAEIERRNRELAEALREIGLALSATLDMDEVLDKILESIAQVIPYDSGNITLLSGNHAIITRSRGYERFGEGTLQAVHQFVFEVESTENFRWMMENRRPLIIQNTHAYPGWIRLEATDYIHSWVGAPIIVQNEVLGFLSLDKCEENFYKPEHARILELFAAQAGQALYNARLYRQSRQMLEYEKKTKEILEKITASIIDLQSTVHQINYLGCQAIGADAGVVELYDPQNDRLITLSYYDTIGRVPQVSYLPRGVGVSWQAIEERKPVIVEHYSGHPNAHPQLKDEGMYAFLAMPIMSEDEVLGVLNYIMLSPEKKFDSGVLGLVETLARYSAIAIQKARLLDEANRRAQEAETLQQASAAVSSALRLDQVLDQVLENLERVVPYDSCALFLKEDDSLRVVAARGFAQPEKVINRRFPAKDELLLASIKQRLPLILSDAQQDPRFKCWGDAAHVRSWMGVPLIKRNDVIGFLTIDHSQPNVYTQNHAKLAQAFANQAATAIENARLFESVQRLAVSDPLTGLYNRRHFFEQAAKEFYRARRYGKDLSLIMMDLDDLKLINDTYGHLVGDQMLISVAERCQKQLRKADLAARFGGDEFILLLPETSLERAIQVAWRLREAVASGLVVERVGKVSSGVSLGVSTLDSTCNSLELMVNRADQALYTAKESGKNRVCAWIDGQVRSFVTHPLVLPKDQAV